MPENQPCKRSLDQSSVEPLRTYMHTIERLNAETDYIRQKLTEYRQLDVARTDLQAGSDSLQAAADFLRDVLDELSEHALVETGLTIDPPERPNTSRVD